MLSPFRNYLRSVVAPGKNKYLEQNSECKSEVWEGTIFKDDVVSGLEQDGQ